MASDTPPVQEVLRDGLSAELVDFFSPEDQADAVSALLDDPSRRRKMALAAQKDAAAYSSEAGLEAWIDLLYANSDQTAQSPPIARGAGV